MRFNRFNKQAIIGIAPLLVLLAGCGQAPVSPSGLDKAAAQAPPPAQSPVERGKYLVTVAGCHDCHSPKVFGPKGPEVDMTKVLSGSPADDKLPKVPKGLFGPMGFGTLANGHTSAWVGPWGVSFAMNLTPDKDTGLGSWTEEMFVKTIRTGKHQGTGRDILPPMPWNGYANMTDDDLKAVFAYLQSLPPVKNAVHDPIPPDKVQ